jgi:LysM repeat protein
MTGQGANRTALGKGKDAATLVSKAYSELKTKITNSKPVKDFDQKVSDVLSKIGMGAKDPQFQGEVTAWVQKYRDMAQAHPIIQGAVYATLIGLAGLASGGVGIGALGLLKMADKLIQGERFSKAGIAGAETAALAGGVHAAKDAYGAASDAVHNAYNHQFGPGQMAVGDNAMASHFPNEVPANSANQFTPPDADATQVAPAPTDSAPAAQNAQANTDAAGAGTTGGVGGDSMAGQFAGGQYSIQHGDTLGSIAQANGVPEADLQGLNPHIDFTKPLQPDMKINLPQQGPNTGSVWQGYQGGNYGDHAQAAAGVGPQTPSNGSYGQATPTFNGQPMHQMQFPDDAGSKMTPRPNIMMNPNGQGIQSINGVPMRESRVYIDSRQTARTWMLRESLGRARGGVILTEAGINAVLFSEGALDKIGSWFKQKGKNVTTKVTADKLNKAWQKAGMPNDSEQISQMLVKAGVGQAVINDIYNGLGIPTTAQTGAQQQGPKQGMLGRAASAVGGAVGGVRGAVAGAKDAYAGGKATGYQAGRQNQGGEYTGASDAQNPYADIQNRMDARGGQNAQSSQSTSASQGSGYGTPQSQTTNAQGQQGQGQQGQGQQRTNAQPTQGAEQGMDQQPTQSSTGNAANALSGAVNAATDAIRYGAGQGAGGRSVAPQGTRQGKTNAANVQVLKDKSGKQYRYTKRNGKWYDEAGGEVPASFALTLDNNVRAGQLAQGKQGATGAFNQMASNLKGTDTRAQGKNAAGADVFKNIASTVSPTTNMGPGQSAAEQPQPTQIKTPATAAKATASTTTPDFSKALMQPTQSTNTSYAGPTGYGKVTMNAPTGVSLPATSPAMAQAKATQQAEPTQKPTTAAELSKQFWSTPAQPTTQAAQPNTAQQWKGRNKNVVSAQQAQQTESLNFAGILWRQLKENK